MTFFIYILLVPSLLTLQSVDTHASPGLRHRRSVLQMFYQMTCVQKECSPLNYLGYGCWCGSGGDSHPMDGIDNCCMEHDFCYDQIKEDCFELEIYTSDYSWSCKRGQPLCLFTQADAMGTCLQKLCECDEMFTRCLKGYPCPSQKAKCPSDPERHDKLHQVAKFIDPHTIKNWEFSALEVLAKTKKKIADKQKKTTDKISVTQKKIR